MAADRPTFFVRILGHAVIEIGGNVIEPAPPKVRQVLALLAFRAGETVSVETLVDELWPHEPPRTAVTTAQTYIYGLRQLINAAVDEDAGKATIRTRRPGYVLALHRSNIDVHCFRATVAEARSHIDSDKGRASALLRQALATAPSSPLTDIPIGPVLRTFADEFREEALTARQLAIALEMSHRNPEELIGELRSLTAAHPLRESFAELLINALHAADRRAEALETFRIVRGRLNDELGIEPCGSLQELHQNVLRDEAARTAVH